MRNLGESVASSELILELTQEAVVELDDAGALFADQVVVVSIALLRGQFESGCTVPEIVASHQPHALQGVHVPVDGRQIAVHLSQRGVDFLDRQRRRVLAEHIEDGLAWGGDLEFATA